MFNSLITWCCDTIFSSLLSALTAWNEKRQEKFPPSLLQYSPLILLLKAVNYTISEPVPVEMLPYRVGKTVCLFLPLLLSFVGRNTSKSVIYPVPSQSSLGAAVESLFEMQCTVRSCSAYLTVHWCLQFVMHSFLLLGLPGLLIMQYSSSLFSFTQWLMPVCQQKH